MKLLLVIAAFCSATSAQLESGQMPSQKAVRSEVLKPTIPGQDVKRIKVRYGPYKIHTANSTEKFGNADSMDPAGTGYNYLVDDIPKDATILQTLSRLIYEDGSEADLSSGVYDHHFFFADTAKTQTSVLACPDGSIPTGIPTSIFMSGAPFYFTNPDASINAGYYIGKDDKLMLNVDLVNYSDEVKNIYIECDIQYVEGTKPGALETAMYTIATDLCAGTGVAVHPPSGVKQFSLNSPEFVVREDGQILQVGGHLHDGGEHITTTINGEVVCDSKAIYGGDGATLNNTETGEEWTTISDMTKCHDIKMSKGDKLSLQAFYDLQKHPSREHIGGGMAEQMALITAFIALDA